MAPRNQGGWLGQDHPGQEVCGNIPFSVAQRKSLLPSGQSTSDDAASALPSHLAAAPYHWLAADRRTCGWAGDSMAPLTCLQAACSSCLWPESVAGQAQASHLELACGSPTPYPAWHYDLAELMCMRDWQCAGHRGQRQVPALITCQEAVALGAHFQTRTWWPCPQPVMPRLRKHW